MNTQRIEFRIGLMAITAFAVLVVMTLQFSKSSLLNFGSEYRIRVRFESAAGVTVGVPVSKSGVEIGRVSGVKLVENDCAVEVTAMIRSDRILYKREECRLKPAMLMGKTSLEFVRANTSSDDQSSDEVIPTDGTAMLRGVVPTDIFNSFSSMEGDLSQAITQVSRAAENLASFLSNMNIFLGDSEAIELKQKMISDLLTETTDTVHDLRVLVHNTNIVIGDPNISQNLRQVAQDFPAVVKKLDETMTSAQSLVTEVRQVVGKVETSLDDVTPIIHSVRDDIPAITGSVKKSAAKLENVFDEVAMLVEAVNNANGTIKQLINDPTLYENISGTVKNVERITSDLQPIIRDVKPITHNARVFTDKLARNPGVIISGALRKEPPLKGGLPSWGDSLGSDCLNSECLDDAVIRAYPELAMLGHMNAMVPEKKKSCLSLFSFGNASNRGKSESQRFLLPHLSPMMTEECYDCAATHGKNGMNNDSMYDGMMFYDNGNNGGVYEDATAPSAPHPTLPPISLAPSASLPVIPPQAAPLAQTPHTPTLPRVIQTAEYRIPQRGTLSTTSVAPATHTQEVP